MGIFLEQSESRSKTNWGYRHPEDLDDEDDDGDTELKDAPNGVPPVPDMSTNGEISS